MIGATVALLLAVVTAFLSVNIRGIRALGRTEAAARGKAVEEAMEQLGLSLARSVAVSSQTFLSEHNYTDLRLLVAAAIQSNLDVRFIRIAQDSGAVVADSALRDVSPDRMLDDGLSRQLAEKAPGEVLTLRDTADPSLWVFATSIYELKSRAEGASARKIGEIRVGISMAKQARALAESYTATEARVGSAVRVAGSVAGIIFLFGILLSVFEGLRITRPIMTLASHAERIAEGQFDTRVPVTGNDEIAVLSTKFNYMTGKIVSLIEEVRSRAALDKELEVARVVQDSLVPRGDEAAIPGVCLASHFEPASVCGGDWWTYRELGGDKVFLAIGDVTGHGIAAALITASVMGACETSTNVEPEDFMGTLGKAVHHASRGRFWMSCFTAVYDRRTSTLSYTNAGHNFPFVLRWDEERGVVVDSLVAKGNILGDGDAMAHVKKTRELRPGDVLVMFTDGVIECRNKEKKEWGERRFLSALKQAAKKRPPEGKAPPFLVGEIMTALRAHTGDEPPHDDITLVVAEFAQNPSA
jgi:serine phosphatase RsbU (regulator of sigma subunit)/HAMP domain-containing protein